jgi:hypothetical protein
LTPEELLPIAEEDGIPIAWIPPPTVLKALAAASSPDRLAVLFTHRRAVLESCRSLLAECDDAWISDERALLRRALDALDAGYHEAAMALALVLGERLAIWASEPRVHVFESKADHDAWTAKRKPKYSMARLELSGVAPNQRLERFEVLRHALIGPIPRFFTPFYADQGQPIPDTVSRHAAVHQPTVKHFSEENALLGIMLSTSILREQQEWCEEVRMSEVE